ncbi:VanW family protein [Virgibacillus sp. W0181]|uniref:VanW family protein n=1 Tax=Virgibacillus sp. W0181 TaxID=3391581 RepID=UPI003F44A5F4
MHVVFISLSILTMSPLSVSETLTVKDNGEPVEVLEREDYAMPLQEGIFINDSKLNVLMEKIDQATYKKPVNATISENNNIIEEKAGSRLDKKAFSRIMYHFYYTGAPSHVDIPKKTVYPRIDSELLSEIHDKKIGEYETHFKESNRERSHNIDLSAKAINNHVVFPGEKFSFNKIVGKRTEEKGYKKAPVIVEGELAEDIGGGICQVSSTLFNAVNLDGIEIVERYSHSRSVPYVPPGKDATVSWWGPDFVFQNKYDHAVLIRAHAKNGKMKIRIYSSASAKPLG